MMYQFLITSFFEVVYFLKLGPIFVASYPSESKSNHKNNQLAQILGQKSPFGGLCNFVRKKGGHATDGDCNGWIEFPVTGAKLCTGALLNIDSNNGTEGAF